jgi:hypothetical protein
MLGRALRHARTNAIAYMALFFALTGTAVATHENIRSSDIVDDQVRTEDVRNDDLAGGGLTPPDLRAASVGSSELSPSAFVSTDVAPTPSGPYGIPSDAIQSSEVSAVLDAHETGYSTCDPGNSTYIDCKELTFQLGRSMPVFATWTYGFGTDGEVKPSGGCRVLIDGASGVAFDLNSEDDEDYNLGGLPVADVVNLEAGTHTLGFQCREYDSGSNNRDIVIRQAKIAAVELGFD